METQKTVVVNFACQNCFQPIVLDESMNNLSVHHLAELARKFCPSAKIILFIV